MSIFMKQIGDLTRYNCLPYKDLWYDANLVRLKIRYKVQNRYPILSNQWRVGFLD